MPRWHGVLGNDLSLGIRQEAHGAIDYFALLQAEEEKYGPEGRIVEDSPDFDEDVEDIEDEEKINEDRRMCKRRVSERASKVRARPSSVLFRGDRLRQQVHRAVDLRSDGRHGVYGAFEGEDRS